MSAAPRSLLSGEKVTYRTFKMTEKSYLIISQGDITKWNGGEKSAIVNAANERMLGGGGVDGAIHRAAGPGLVEACKQVPEVLPGVRCLTGEARITAGFLLPAGFVIHTVGPIYSSHAKSSHLLANAYKNSLLLANNRGLQAVAFPAISCGAYGYPLDDAATVAIQAILLSHNKIPHVEFVLAPNTYPIFVKAAEENLGIMSAL